MKDILLARAVTHKKEKVHLPNSEHALFFCLISNYCTISHHAFLIFLHSEE